ncbi:MAG: YabP/YqfC family sporulation protein [Clostridia bacterium]|nr:YabP/YqfC family sporulation protein [Clostridia bacterium]
MESNTHKIIIENRSENIITSVLEVLSFSDKELKIKLVNSTIIKIIGENLKIIGFDNQSGNFKAKGLMVSINYKGKEESFFKRVLK